MALHLEISAPENTNLRPFRLRMEQNRGILLDMMTEAQPKMDAAAMTSLHRGGSAVSPESS